MVLLGSVKRSVNLVGLRREQWDPPHDLDHISRLTCHIGGISVSVDFTSLDAVSVWAVFMKRFQFGLFSKITFVVSLCGYLFQDVAFIWIQIVGGKAQSSRSA